MARPRGGGDRDLRAAAVAAAVALLAERASPPPRLSEIAERIGCRTPALYHHFRDRAALLGAVRDEGFARLMGTKLRVAAEAGGDPLDRLARGGRAYIAFALENPGLYRLMFTDAGGADDPFAAEPGRATRAALAGAVRDAQAAGYMPGEDPDRMAFLLWSAVHGAADLLLGGRVPAETAARAELADHAVATLMRWIAADRRDGRSQFTAR